MGLSLLSKFLDSPFIRANSTPAGPKVKKTETVNGLEFIRFHTETPEKLPIYLYQLFIQW
jgi:hypothetical protein